MGIDEPWYQELSSRQVQHLELSGMTDILQERLYVPWRCLRAYLHGLLDGFDDTILADVDQCIGEDIVRTLVDGRDDSASDEERHWIIREICPDRTLASRLALVKSVTKKKKTVQTE